MKVVQLKIEELGYNFVEEKRIVDVVMVVECQGVSFYERLNDQMVQRP